MWTFVSLAKLIGKLTLPKAFCDIAVCAYSPKMGAVCSFNCNELFDFSDVQSRINDSLGTEARSAPQAASSLQSTIQEPSTDSHIPDFTTHQVINQPLCSEISFEYSSSIIPSNFTPNISQMSIIPQMQANGAETPPTPKLRRQYQIEGELYQYKPIMRGKFQCRWCCLEAAHFMYYKDELSKVLGSKPLVAVPFHRIRHVSV